MTENTITLSVEDAKTIADMLRELARQTRRAGDIWEYSAMHIATKAAALDLLLEGRR